MGRVSDSGLTLTHSCAPLTPLLLRLQGLVAEFLASNVDWLGAQVPGAKLEQIAESMQPAVYEDGQVAFRSGDTANSLMVITKGAAKYVPRIGGSGGGTPAEETLGVGAGFFGRRERAAALGVDARAFVERSTHFIHLALEF